MISGYLIGDRQMVLRLGKVGPEVINAMARSIDTAGVSLARTVVTDFLSGPRPTRLGRVTGRLASSISRGAPETRSRFERLGDVAIAYVGTNVPYGKVWETTGLPARKITAKGKALKFEIGGVTFFRKSVNVKAVPARPFLKPALEQRRADIVALIKRDIAAAGALAMKS